MESATQPTTSNPKPLKRKIAYKIDRAKVQSLAAQGIRPCDIAKIEGVSDSTITRYLQSVNLQLPEIKRYTSMRADVLAGSQLKFQTIADLIAENWLNHPELLLQSQDVRLQKEVLVAVQGAKTYDFNSERLERGESTGNIDYRVQSVNLNADLATVRDMLSQARGLREGNILPPEIKGNDIEVLP